MKKLIVVLLLCAFGIAKAQKPAVMVDKDAGWHKISETSVNFSKDTDEIVVLGADKFKAIKFKVTDGAIHLLDLKVYYEEGDAEDVKVAMDIPEGTMSRQIDLKGSTRELKKVVFVYHSVKGSTKDKAHVELYGMK
jgi:hypothetical protein